MILYNYNIGLADFNFLRSYMNITHQNVALVVQWLVCLLLDPKVVGSNPAKAMDF
jgi:hypothetical protein